MKLKYSIIFCLVTGVFCACNQTGQERIDPPATSITPVPAVSLTPEPSLMPTLVPTVTAMPEEKLLPIDEEHFTSEVFRKRIAKEYDLNKDGYLSETERAEVKKIDINYYEWEFSGECLDGFEYFPNLEGLGVSQGEKVIVRNHPSLLWIGGEEGLLGTLTVENCPKLKRLSFYSIPIDDLTISGDTTAELLFSYNSGAHHMTLEATVAVSFEDDEYLNYFYKDADGNLIPMGYDLEKYVFNDFTEWTGLGEVRAPLGAEEINDFLTGNVVDCFSFGITKMPEGTADNAGNQGYQVIVDQGWGYPSMTFEVYAENAPAEADFFVRPAEVQRVEVLKYSPKRGTVAKVKWRLEIGYRGAEKEIILTQTERNHYVLMIPDGTVKGYNTRKNLEESNEWNFR